MKPFAEWRKAPRSIRGCCRGLKVDRRRDRQIGQERSASRSARRFAGLAVATRRRAAQDAEAPFVRSCRRDANQSSSFPAARGIPLERDINETRESILRRNPSSVPPLSLSLPLHCPRKTIYYSMREMFIIRLLRGKKTKREKTKKTQKKRKKEKFRKRKSKRTVHAARVQSAAIIPSEPPARDSTIESASARVSPFRFSLSPPPPSERFKRQRVRVPCTSRGDSRGRVEVAQVASMHGGWPCNRKSSVIIKVQS